MFDFAMRGFKNLWAEDAPAQNTPSISRASGPPPRAGASQGSSSAADAMQGAAADFGGVSSFWNSFGGAENTASVGLGSARGVIELPEVEISGDQEPQRDPGNHTPSPELQEYIDDEMAQLMVLQEENHRTREKYQSAARSADDARKGLDQTKALIKDLRRSIQALESARELSSDPARLDSEIREKSVRVSQIESVLPEHQKAVMIWSERAAQHQEMLRRQEAQMKSLRERIAMMRAGKPVTFQSPGA